MTRMSKRHLLILGVSLLMLVTLSVPASAAGTTTVIDGLSGPLGLAIGDDGTVYVTEAFGGRLTAVDKKGNAKVLVDLAGNEIAGVDATGKGTLVFTQTLFDGEPGEEAEPLEASLARVQPNGKTSNIASTLAYEAANNPDAVNTYGLVGASEACLAQISPFFPPTNTGIVESHPYAVAIVPGGYAVADAAANAIFKVRANGKVSTLAVLPPIPQEITAETVAMIGDEFGLDISDCEGETYHGEPVPTDIEVGPDGYYYVSTLPGFPEAPGAGAVWKVHPRTGAITLVADGLVGPVDIAVAADGTIWVAELFAFQISTISGGVVTPYMFADSPGAIEVARDGSVYITTGVFGPNGAVEKITP